MRSTLLGLAMFSVVGSVALPAASAATRCPLETADEDAVRVKVERASFGGDGLKIQLAVSDPFSEIREVRVLARRGAIRQEASASQCGDDRFCASIPAFELEGEGALSYWAVALNKKQLPLACAARPESPARIEQLQALVPPPQAGDDAGAKGPAADDEIDNEASARAAAALAETTGTPELLRSPWFWGGVGVAAVAVAAVALPLAQGGSHGPRGTLGSVEVH